MTITRREFLTWISAGAGATALSACEADPTRRSQLDEPARGSARVVVVGGGYAGATTAKYVKMWAPDIDVVLVEGSPRFISCPISNLVLAGNTTLQDITMGYDALRARGVRLAHDAAGNHHELRSAAHPRRARAAR